MKIIVCSFVLLALLLILGKVVKRNELKHKYKSCESIFSPTELRFFVALKKAVSHNETIFAKVRQADIFEVIGSKKTSAFWRAFNKVSKRHVDFVLCDQETCRPLMIIELNDKSHKRADRKKRDLELREAIAQTPIKLIEINAARNYVPDEIKKQIYATEKFSDDYARNANQQKESQASIQT